MNAQLLELLGPAPGGRATALVCVVCAAALHLGLGLLLMAEPVVPSVYPVTEVELTLLPKRPPPEPPAAPPEPAPSSPPPSAAAPDPVARPRAVRRAAAPAPPAAAHAGALLTAADDATATREPVRFVSDPNGRGYGSGSVARGGVAERGDGSATAQPRPAAASSEPITPADRLRRAPVLIGDGCRGFFPSTAREDQGSVSLILTVRASGAIGRLDIEAETPPGQGFARAARACLEQRRFSPALDETGKPTAARTHIDIRFTR